MLRRYAGELPMFYDKAKMPGEAFDGCFSAIAAITPLRYARQLLDDAAAAMIRRRRYAAILPLFTPPLRCCWCFVFRYYRRPARYGVAMPYFAICVIRIQIAHATPLFFDATP